jgi:hypothetical protein
MRLTHDVARAEFSEDGVIAPKGMVADVVCTPRF